MSTDMLSATAMRGPMQESAGRAVAGPSHAHLMQLAAIRGGAPVVQRAIADHNVHIAQAPGLVRALSAGAQARLDAVMQTLIAFIANDHRINVGSIHVAIEQEGGNAVFHHGVSGIAGENPALTHTAGNRINIVIQRPFAEAATKGELYGLLAHEIGVHNIPTDFEGIDDTAVRDFDPLITPRKQDKGNTVSGGYERAQWPVGGNARDGHRQHDHALVGNIVNPQRPVNPVERRRAESYLETVLSIGDQIDAGGGSAEEKAEETTQLVHLYLVDIARIIATDDGRMPIGRHLLALNDVYQWVFTNVVLPERGNHAWIPAEAPKANSFTLTLSLGFFYRRITKEKERDNEARV